MKDDSSQVQSATVSIRIDDNDLARRKKDEMTAILASCKGQKHLVIIQNYPDPDAISTGLAHKVISEQFGIEVDIVYAGVISHPENIALVKLLGIDMRKWDSKFDLTPYQATIFVDNQGTTSGTIVDAVQAMNIPELIVVDHHELQNRLKPQFIDIRKVGATATIYTSYFREGIIQLERSRNEHVRAATALMHGIKTDTNGFVRASSEDFIAAAFLSRFVDADLLSQITSQSRSKQTMGIIEGALANRTIKESYSISGIGYVRCEERDAIPQAADFLMTEENIHSAIVFGLIVSPDQEETIVGSMRTSRITIDPDEFLKEVFGKTSSGQYFGGGKKSAGGFEIPVGFLSGGGDKEFRDMKWKLYKAQITQKILSKIGGIDEDEENGE
ncbi:MAG: bifunctional oligoribonuclease/PAP phosphatase NrnA [Candidatus Riflebacteria bacterium]|nr:bifunctional oligoribonuclease/PAP phosphatase NrnA [Candidatus Riflebacteria bacterium]